MNILAIPTTYGLSKPICGGQNRFSNITKELKKNHKIFVLESDLLVDPMDINIAKIYAYKEYKIFNRFLTIFRDINIHYILSLVHILKNEQIDLIQISHPSGIIIVKIITKLTQKNIPIIYDAHNVESSFVIETFANNLKYSLPERLIIPIYTKFLEQVVCKYIVDHITSVSEIDKDVFIRLYKLRQNKITVIPSGCHASKLIQDDYKLYIKKCIGIDLDKLVLFFHGSFSHPPNKEAFDKIINYIAPNFEGINNNVLFMVGGTDVPKFKQTNIISLGFIEDLDNMMSVADIAIVPLIKGAGTKLKTLDYLGAGLPIVTTKKGIEGINARNGSDAIIVDNVNEEFIEAIEYLIDKKQERERIGTNARMLAENEYNWVKIVDKLDKLYRSILEEYICK